LRRGRPALSRGAAPCAAGPDLHYNLGVALASAGQHPEAIASLRRALALAPKSADAHAGIGASLQALGRHAEALDAYALALALEPRFPEAHNNAGNALQALGRFEEAIRRYEQAIAARPGYADALGNLGNALRALGRHAEALARYRQALAAGPGQSQTHSNLLLTLNYMSGIEPAAVFEEHCAWAALHADALAASAPPHANDRDAERRLRVGYVSPDFCGHSVAWFLERVLPAHDRRQVEVHCFSDVARPDAMTAALKRSADRWHDVVRLDDAGLAGLVRGHGIDVLVDLAGHTAGNRLLAFARKPAPVLASWLGYPNTTGMRAMDYRLTDAVADPDGESDRLHAERLIRLPHGFHCYAPPLACPEPGDLPCLSAGGVTFASFNNYAKLSAPTVSCWAELLAAAPGSRLLLKAPGLAHESAKADARRRFAEHGIEPSRIEIPDPAATPQEHLAHYRRADIALDPFPYNGTTTTCEALWMGVPVVSLRGTVHAARVGASLLERVGLGELVASDARSYVRIALGLATDRDRLARLRSGLRERVARSPLADGAAFARNLEDAYRDAWRAWCAGKGGSK
jgi:predicted O-linked N-acetylglucosamine transferase (SPINDLY family)